MSRQLLKRVADDLSGRGFLVGYEIKYYRWEDSDVEGNTPFVLFRQEGTGGGGGTSDVHLQQTDITIRLVDNSAGATAADDAMNTILRHFRLSSVPAGVIKYQPITNVVGPMYLENGRPMFELVVRVFTEDQ